MMKLGHNRKGDNSFQSQQSKWGPNAFQCAPTPHLPLLAEAVSVTGTSSARITKTVNGDLPSPSLGNLFAPRNCLSSLHLPLRQTSSDGSLPLTLLENRAQSSGVTSNCSSCSSSSAHMQTIYTCILI